jgi:UPF0716 protein FxsA
MFRLFLLFTIIPATELWLLFKVGENIGLLETIYLIILTGIIGAAMAKREGLKVILELQNSLQKGISPGTKIIEGLLVLVGGLLLITPGILTDIFGFSLIFPLTRKALAPLIQIAATKNLKNTSSNGFHMNFGQMRAGPGFKHPVQNEQDVLNVEVETTNHQPEVEEKIFKHPTF